MRSLVHVDPSVVRSAVAVCARACERQSRTKRTIGATRNNPVDRRRPGDGGQGAWTPVMPFRDRPGRAPASFGCTEQPSPLPIQDEERDARDGHRRAEEPGAGDVDAGGRRVKLSALGPNDRIQEHRRPRRSNDGPDVRIITSDGVRSAEGVLDGLADRAVLADEDEGRRLAEARHGEHIVLQRHAAEPRYQRRTRPRSIAIPHRPVQTAARRPRRASAGDAALIIVQAIAVRLVSLEVVRIVVAERPDGAARRQRGIPGFLETERPVDDFDQVIPGELSQILRRVSIA